MTPDDAMPYAGTFSYLIAAAIVRSSPGPPTILLLHRSQLPQDPASFELVGGAIFSDKDTVEHALRDKVTEQCGLVVKDIHGSIYDKPEVKLPRTMTWPIVKEAGQVRLEYLVTVNADGPIVHPKKYNAWCWVESVEQAEQLRQDDKMTKTCLRSVTRALERAQELVNDGGV